MLESGQVLRDRYQLQCRLGQNAERQTWLAQDLQVEPPEQVVVKLLAFGPQMHWDQFKLFEREAQVLKNLDHPKIPRYRDYFSLDLGSSSEFIGFGLVQDYIPGASLRQLLDQGRHFTEAQVRRFATEVLSILIYLHELSPPVLHRDIKPSNLILGEDERIYLVDFGAVQARTTAEGATFTVVGSSGYTPLEQFWGRAVPASDLYALGTTLIHLLTGTAPADLPQSDLRIQFADRISVNPSLVSWVQALVEPALERRISTARQALKALKKPRQAEAQWVSQRSANQRIRLQKSPEQLRIQISGVLSLPTISKWVIVTLALLGTLFVFALTAFITGAILEVLVCLLIVLGAGLALGFVQTLVYFDREHFTIQFESFDIPIWRSQGQTSFIQDIRDAGQAVPGVIMQTDRQTYSFGTPGLNQVERQWLIQEIRAWLRSR